MQAYWYSDLGCIDRSNNRGVNLSEIRLGGYNHTTTASYSSLLDSIP